MQSEKANPYPPIWIFLLAVAFSIPSLKLIQWQSTRFEEAQDPHPDLKSDWSTVPQGLQSSVVSHFVRFPKTKIPDIPLRTHYSADAWKGERIYGQILLWSAQPVEDIEFQFSDFISESHNKIPGRMAQARFVRFVLTDEFAGGCGHRKPEDFAVSLVPDMIDDLCRFSIPAKTCRPVWLSFSIPDHSKSGKYAGRLKLKAKGQSDKEFSITIDVLDRALPKPEDWKFYLDLWQNPYAVARYHQVKPWSEEHWALLRPLMKLLAEAGQKTITASINNRPWGTVTEDPYESMIVWTKNTDGSWSYDYTVFDKWVKFMMDLGIKKQINCYSLIPWGNEFFYFDKQSNNEIKLSAKPGSPEYISLLSPFLKDFIKHLQAKGWNEIALLAMDERSPEEMKAMLELVGDIAPEFGISLADNHKSYQQYPNRLKDLSVAYGVTIDDEDLNYRKSRQMISTYYVCCSDAFPNVFTFSPPAEGIWISWYALAARLDGFMRWAYNHWVKDPLVDSRFRTWPAGDTYIVYPDARSSVRFEMLRDGIEDAEKIRILREEFTTKDQPGKLKTLNDLVNQFAKTGKPANTDGMILNAQNILNRL